MTDSVLALIYFVYGLSFFVMGFAIILEVGRTKEVTRLHQALRPLAVFGLLHGANEWLEMFLLLESMPLQETAFLLWDTVRLGLLAFSFLSLAAFGASLLSPNDTIRRISLLAPLFMAGVWGFGLMVLQGRYSVAAGLRDVADVWTRYSLGIPSALLASVGLVAQQRHFRRAGMARFGRDSLWAAVAFGWYGLVGQLFTRASSLAPSSLINHELFLELFGFPIQVLRAGAAGLAALFVMLFLRAFEAESEARIEALQQARLVEARQREALRGELLRRVVSAQEAERQRIARELHDETGQALTAIGLGLRGIAPMVPENGGKSSQNFRKLESLVARSLDELQRIIADLRPSHLDDLGLPAALRWYAGEVESRVPLHVTVEVSGHPRAIASVSKIALFRVVQEALTNVIKHAAAEHAHVSLEFGDDVVSVQIADDGRGFDVTSVGADRPSWGLVGMRERATLLGGRFSLESEPGKGTCVQVVLPYEYPREESHDDKFAVG